jgi:hypothetical protein
VKEVTRSISVIPLKVGFGENLDNLVGKVQYGSRLTVRIYVTAVNEASGTVQLKLYQWQRTLPKSEREPMAHA